MTEKRKWRGIQTNFSLFQGEIVDDPILHNGYAFLTLRTIAVQRDANGQIVEVDQDIPLMAEPNSPNVTVIEKYVKARRKLQVWCYYKSWENQGKQHAFVIKNINLGDKPYEGASEIPPLP